MGRSAYRPMGLIFSSEARWLKTVEETRQVLRPSARAFSMASCVLGVQITSCMPALTYPAVSHSICFPGLYVWLRDGSKVPVKVPDGCLLCQAGKQIEWLTAGYVRAGMHEVICTPKTQEAMEKAR